MMHRLGHTAVNKWCQTEFSRGRDNPAAAGALGNLFVFLAASTWPLLALVTMRTLAEKKHYTYAETRDEEGISPARPQ